MKRIASVLAAAALIVALALAATAGAQTKADPLTIYAAASLTEVFQAYDRAQKYNFAGSNVLETQIRNGAPADIFASAAPLNTQRLFAAGLVDKPVTFTANRLALIVPKSNPAGITSVYDLKTKDVKLVIANAAVPVGSYTRTVLKKMALTVGALQGRQPGVRRQGRDGQGRARPGRRRLRLRHRCASGQRPGDRDQDPRLGAAARSLRDRGRLEVGQQGRRAGMDQGILSAKGQTALKNAGFLPLPKASVVDRVFRATLVLATGVALLFLLLPIAAIFLRVPPGDLISALGTSAARDALIVTAETNAVAMVLIILFGTPTAYWVATRTSRSRDLVVTLIELPLVLPPAVAGIGLLAAFGRLGLLGGTFEALGIDVAFNKVGGDPRGHVRREPVLRSHRRLRAREHRPDAARGRPDARGRARAGSSSASPCRSRPAGSAPARRSPSRAGSASSAPRSCSPARSRA